MYLIIPTGERIVKLRLAMADGDVRSPVRSQPLTCLLGRVQPLSPATKYTDILKILTHIKYTYEFIHERKT